MKLLWTATLLLISFYCTTEAIPLPEPNPRPTFVFLSSYFPFNLLNRDVKKPEAVVVEPIVVEVVAEPVAVAVGIKEQSVVSAPVLAPAIAPHAQSPEILGVLQETKIQVEGNVEDPSPLNIVLDDDKVDLSVDNGVDKIVVKDGAVPAEVAIAKRSLSDSTVQIFI